MQKYQKSLDLEKIQDEPSKGSKKWSCDYYKKPGYGKKDCFKFKAILSNKNKLEVKQERIQK